jgi:aromatic-L-amino-acid/L-tryptophan decarboxylase
VAKGLKTLGFQPDQLRKITCDDGFRLPLPALSAAIAADRAKGLTPFCVVANAGTTNTGAVDPLDALADLAAAEGLWLHVDGAYGGAAAICDTGRAVLAGLARADSLGIDPHKWLFQPYEVGCVLIRERQHLKDTFRVSAEYLKLIEHSAEQPNFSDYGVQLTRGFRALKLWMSLKAFGVDAFREAVERGIANAQLAEAHLRQHPEWEVVTPATLGIVTFRYRPQAANGPLDDAALDSLTMHMARALTESGYAFLSPTTLRGRAVLRLCTINPRTTDADITGTLDRLLALGRDAA